MYARPENTTSQEEDKVLVPEMAALSVKAHQKPKRYSTAETVEYCLRFTFLSKSALIKPEQR